MKICMKRKSYKLKTVFILLLIILICFVANTALFHFKSFGFNSIIQDISNGSIAHNVANEDNGWNLILVNHDNYIPNDYEVKLTELSNGKKVDSRIYPELQEMFNQARSQGYGLFIREGYRTQEEQQQILDEKIEAYENEGNSKAEAKKLAEEWVAIPRTSEH